jgi:hypothetical protein
MTKLRVHAFGISLDGYGAGPGQDLQNPLGAGGLALHDWIVRLAPFGRCTAMSTIATILKQQGIPPSDERTTSWQTFLRADWGALVAADFFTTEVWTLRGLVTYYTVFVIELQSRRVHIVGSTPHPDEAFMLQIARHLTGCGRRRGRRVALPDLRPRSEVERRRSAAARDIRCARHPDTVSRAQLQCARGALCSLNQRGMPDPRDSSG